MMNNLNANQAMENPGVKILPPIIYFIFFFAGIILGRIFPLPFFVSFLARLIIGWPIALASLAVVLLAMKEFRSAHTTIRPDRSVSSLITTGIFTRTRNPLYLSLLLLYCGVSIFLGAWWPIILVPLLVATMNSYVIGREERYLAERFGLFYRNYRTRVRRWI
jgi:protein-S-isoprenylcysteine O-methyltransferase Ste14